ncbi:MAG: hypothetical protein ACLSD3_13910 [Acutalibacteraceae bacterium]
MTYAEMSEIIRSADEMNAELFVNRWLLMPVTEDIKGFVPDDLDAGKNVLMQLHARLTRSIAEIRAESRLTQREFSNRFIVPLNTIKGWESRSACPIYLRLLIAQELGQIDLEDVFGIA